MKKFIKSAWGVGIGTTLLGFILTVIYDLVKSKPILSTIWNIIKAIWNFIIMVLNLELKLWWILLGIIVLILILLVIVKIDDVKNADASNVSFLNYKSDTIQGWKWEWSWKKNYNGQYEIDNLYPVCDSCGTMLASKHDYQNTLYCVRCGKTYNGMALPNETHIKIYISDTARRGLIPNNNT